MVFVKPTSTMKIKSGRNVDTNGKVDLPYLRDWRYPQSDLLGLIQILVIVFGEEPPVFSRAAALTAQSHPPYPGAGPTPYPGQTPYPMQGGGGYPMPMPGSVNQPPEYSQYPAPNTQYPASGFTGYPGGGSTGYPSYPPSGYPPQYPSSTNTYGAPSNLPYPQYTAPGTNTVTSSAQPGSTNTVTEEHLRMSLLSAVEDKMKRRLREMFEQAQAEMNVLHKTQTDLLKGKEKLETMVRNLENEKGEIENNIKLLQDKDQEVKEVLRKLDSQDKLDIDEAIITTTPLYRQLLNSFAEEQAIEDAIYYLGEALRKDVIDMDVFLKQVRELSRKQFFLRALIQKCREKAGLPPMA
ncbi:tumor susceptibility gene 101 protein-like isoform X2 [Ostrea edulis]|nr:tumor susceptibility gene 101 protein-like isoform X2 [Ostrea edulis]XP_056015300.1 tumor susceptibility gene 101 protein-like isoform X2 [Ostrea edulis]